MIVLPSHVEKNFSDEQIQKQQNYLQDFLKNNPRSDFMKFPDENRNLRKEIAKNFSTKKYFIHVGLGGSSLGAETLVRALYSEAKEKRKFFFLNNIDSDEVDEILSQIEWEKSLFYFVSKSGATLETMALMCVIDKKLQENIGDNYRREDYFVFCSDPKKGYMRELSSQWNVPCLDVPENIGGRYSALTDVGLFPCEMAGIDTDAIIKARDQLYTKLVSGNSRELAELSLITHHYFVNNNVDQTVFMPYSSKLKYLSLWFVQLWAESLGKKRGSMRTGLTPLFAYGPTDQHSQMQLFMDGPRNKFLYFVEVENTKTQLSIQTELTHKNTLMMNNKDLHRVLSAELKGSRDALAQNEVPFASFKLDKIGEKSLTELMLSIANLTVLVANLLEIDPFDQPGVELGKVLSAQYLEKSR
ncbi:MAG: hypothetical protein H6621_01095 [Halobacteriovoraceae bacterium]|nr:hypothetical protein [Halobacteriovoraceae bacterium]MCB9093638.1 hypothetical protein [Halobacteriovoraceae bacterium]